MLFYYPIHVCFGIILGLLTSTVTPQAILQVVGSSFSNIFEFPNNPVVLTIDVALRDIGGFYYCSSSTLGASFSNFQSCFPSVLTATMMSSSSTRTAYLCHAYSFCIIGRPIHILSVVAGLAFDDER